MLNFKMDYMKMRTTKWILIGLVVFGSCKKDADSKTGIDPNTAETAVIDRFSAAAGHLQVRNGSNLLPDPNQGVDFDQSPFITTGLTPGGQPVQYYNFDVQPEKPASIWAFFKNGQPLSGQLNIINVIPGDSGYNDFWQVYKVNVPNDYTANTITSYDDLIVSGYAIEKPRIL